VTDPLLPYFDRELEFFRQMGVDFAERYPKIASRLQLDAGGSQDPHVERLIQAFAFLNARIRHKLDDDFPEVAESFLNVLYPQYLAPMPSMSIVQFAHDRQQGELTTSVNIPRGTFLETDRVEGETCTFQTAYPVSVWPIQLSAASLESRPFQGRLTDRAREAESQLRVSLSTFSRAATFPVLKPSVLRFHICCPRYHDSAALYELLFSGTLDVAISGGPNDTQPVSLGPQALKPVGFGRDEGLLPYSARSFLGYRLLAEYFAFPQKYLFFDVEVLTPEVWSRCGDKAQIQIFLRESNAEIERHVSSETLRLGCTPVVNLFPQRADPIAETHRQTEYRVVPDARRIAALEVFSIDRVTATTSTGKSWECLPLYAARHGGQAAQHAFWHASRRPAGDAGGDLRAPGTEMFLTLVDLDFSPVRPADTVLHIDTTCTNGDLPGRMGPRGEQVRFHMPGGAGAVSEIRCLLPPTPTRRPDMKHGQTWRLISHLTLNHLSLDVRDASAESLKEILRLYDVLDSTDTRDMIDGIVDVRCRRGVARVGGAAGGFCRGLDVEIVLDDDKFTGSGVYLFAAVLNHFFGLYVSINSYSRFRAATRRREERGHWWTWPPRAGEQPLQ